MGNVPKNIEKNCSQIGFKALIVTQFLGAFNDNLYKLVVSLIVVNALVAESANSNLLVLITVLFSAPYILFSHHAGFLADKFSKTRVAISTKFMEVVVMSFGCYFFMVENINGLLVVLFFMGLQSTLFSPAKYGMMPEILSKDNLSRGNGYLECWTFVAIIAGTSASGVIKELAAENLLIPGIAVVSVAILGFISSLFIEKVPASGTSRKFEINPFKVLAALAEIKQNRSLFLVVLGITFFWSIGALFQLNILLYAKTLAGLSDSHTSVLIAGMAIGIGIGALIAGAVSAGKVELGLVPIGGIGLSVAAILLNYTYHSFVLTIVVLFFLGVSAGVFSVPLNAYLQDKSPAESRGRFIAASNVLCFIGMLGSAILLKVMIDWIGFNAGQVFLVTGILTILATIIICRMLPEVMVRCLNWIFTHTVYRVKVFGKENIPETGGALIVCNHITYVDASILLASIERLIRFLIYEPIYRSKIVKPFADAAKAIPIAAEASPKATLKSLIAARNALKNGEVVGIFAEGGLTRIGNLLPFNKGLEFIMNGVDAPIIPAYLDQMWGSIFSFKKGKFFWKFPRRLPYPASIHYGKPMPANSKTYQVRESVQELSSAAFADRGYDKQELRILFIKSAKKNIFKNAISDSSGKSLSYFSLLSLSLSLKNIFSRDLADEDMVGVFLPPSVGAALANIALLFAGKIPVNLNYTAGDESLQSAISKCSIKTVVSSKKFLSEYPLPAGVKVNNIEDLIEGIAHRAKLFYAGCSLFLPVFLLQTLLKKTNHENGLATVIFSSGSTSEPKGVMLSNQNIISNINGMNDVFQINKTDCMMGVLPFFHSFGFTATLWLPLISGIRSCFHYNPLDGQTIGKLVSKHRASLLITTPTFLSSYTRKCSKEQFKSLRLVGVGAEKLKDRIAQAFMEKFGISPMEGYGCTELSPVVSMNIPNVMTVDGEQVGSKAGTVGHPLPGISVKVVSPHDFQKLNPGQSGVILVKGPNVMLGYLGEEEKTKEVIKDGWYLTGDIGQVDEDGFITITDRISRFSKIAGEMVPHLKIEEEIHEILGVHERICVVTAIGDDSRGERLVVLLTVDFDHDQIIKSLSAKGFPNLWIPKRDSLFRIDKFPLLGSGKLDLVAVKELAFKCCL
jgi:acyl-[acyl-carrier-protein]-phospholipid O-acyltransferase/long-chain-fatty-acid--[acyl-carrier-protein] ligase